MAQTLVIAEPGCTHEGRKATMLRLLETAHACGANVWKPQWVSDPVAMCERRNIGKDHPKRAYYERAYGWLKFPIEWHAEFQDRCHVLKMQYACSVFLPQDVATVAPFVYYIKIASFENSDSGLLTAAIRSGRRVIVSTGMMKRWSWPLLRLKWHQWWNGARLLQCTSAYPVSVGQLNLATIRACGLNGLSDHSKDMTIGGVAVGAGARIIEAHYALNECAPNNPDYQAAFGPGEFEVYIRNIRKAERAMGTGSKRSQGQETWALPYKV